MPQMSRCLRFRRSVHRRQRTTHPSGTSTVRCYKADDSIFIDDAYLIKGIAGRILWKHLQSYTQNRRVDFRNKEIRLDASLQVPDFKDNLEPRLIVLRRQLKDRCDFINLTQVGRGPFHLEMQREITLDEIR